MQLSIVICQMQSILGDIDANFLKIKNFYENNLDSQLVVYPEFALCGYSPCDELFNLDFQNLINLYIHKLVEITQSQKTAMLVGSPYFIDNKIYNVALFIQNGEIKQIIYKSCFPNYGVFNEHRYFSTINNQSNIIEFLGVKIGVFICEDMWREDFVDKVVSQNPQILISINASVFESNKYNIRKNLAQNVVKKAQVPLIYLNCVGALDEVVFDGSSFYMNLDYKILYTLTHCIEDTLNTMFHVKHREIISKNQNSYNFDENYLNYQAIILSLRNFISLNNFKGVIIGLSGGIDSVLSATLATDALGSQNVMLVSMPSKYTSSLSKQIISECINNLQVKFLEIPIDDILNTYKTNLANLDLTKNFVLENLQARIRGNILMSLSNIYSNFMVLTTGNKSEIATGYSTLYGDSCGGFNLLKDLYKTQIFSISNYRNANIPQSSLLQKLNVIPLQAITRAPSAELRDNQKDEDSLLPYETLDKILYQLIENNSSTDELYKNFNQQDVKKVLKLLKNSHYKRMQSAQGVKLSSQSLNSREYIYPLAIKYNELQ